VSGNEIYEENTKMQMASLQNKGDVLSKFDIKKIKIFKITERNVYKFLPKWTERVCHT
jgi:hypothetical protein